MVFMCDLWISSITIICNWLEMQILGPHFRLTESEIVRVGLECCVLTHLQGVPDVHSNLSTIDKRKCISFTVIGEKEDKRSTNVDR